MPQTRVARWQSRVGRQDELEKTGTGEAEIFIHDVEGLYDSFNISSPFSGALDGAPVSLNLRNPVTDTEHQRFRGYVEEYAYDLSPSGRNTDVTIRCVDAFDYLSTAEMAPRPATSHGFPLPATVEPGSIFYEDAEVDSRIHALLDDAGWPEDLRVIFSGNVIVAEAVYDAGYSFLAALYDAADAEWPGVANVYVEHSTGKIALHGRHARFDPDTTAADAGGAWNFRRWKVGDGAAVHADISDTAQLRPPVAFDRSVKMVYNAALITPIGVEEADIEGQQVTDSTSIAQFGTRSYTATDIRVLEHKTNGDNALDQTLKMGQYYVLNYAEPRTRPRQITVKALHPDDPRAAATWAFMCGVEISDIINLKLTLAGGGIVDEDFFVEGISTTCSFLNPEYDMVEVTCDISPQSYYDTDPFSD